jgi:micrococcal nuclease
MRIFFIIYLLVSLGSTSRSYCQNSYGTITDVLDGDTYEISSRGYTFRARLQGIDCPESGQPFGDEAKSFAETFLNEEISYTSYGYDVYERQLVEIFISGRSLNQLLVRNGYAWHFIRYSSNTTLARLELEARQSNIGLWGASNPIPPWEWRNNSPTQSPASLVHICVSQSSTRYHRSEHCSGFNRCRSRRETISLNDATQMRRSPCNLCY